MAKSSWSDRLLAITRSILNDRDHVPMRDYVYLKNINGRFGEIGIADWLGGWPMTVADREDGTTSLYESCDALIADGWAVD